MFFVAGYLLLVNSFWSYIRVEFKIRMIELSVF